MIGIYFSGSGNTKLACTYFVHKIERLAQCYAMEDPMSSIALQNAEEIVFAYPIYYSTLPKIVSDFIEQHASLWQGKRIFLIATMGLFSGDGCGCGARAFRRHGAIILGGKHLYMPDCICDEKVLKTSKEKNQRKIGDTKKRLDQLAQVYRQGNYPQQGLSNLSCFAGWITQRLWFSKKTQQYHDKPHIDASLCCGCGQCVSACPMQNLSITSGKVSHHSNCTLCYRCANLCPKKAITILGNTVYMQNKPQG